MSSIHLTFVCLLVCLPTYLHMYLSIWSYWKATKLMRIWRFMVLKRNAMHQDKPYIWHCFSTQRICWYVIWKSLKESCSWMNDKPSRTSDWFTGFREQKIKFATHQNERTVMNIPDFSLRLHFSPLRAYTLGVGVK